MIFPTKFLKSMKVFWISFPK